MAYLGDTIKAADVSQNSYELLPDGWYDAQITETQVKESKSGGTYMNVRYDITGPTHGGRVVFGMINLRCPNSTRAEEIGRGQLAQLINSVGLEEISDSDEILSKKLQIRVETDPAKNGYDARNNVKKFRTLQNTEGSTTQDDVPF